MATHRRHIFKHTDHKTIGFWFIYPAVILFSFHGLIVAYSNSTYLEKFVSPEAVGSLFTIAASLSVFAFLFISRVLRKIGNVRLIIWLSVLEIIALVGLGLAESIREAVVFFVLFAAINPLIYLSLDIFSESIIGSNESSTGSKRGLVLGFMSLAAVFAPLTTGFIVGTDDANLSNTYFVAAGVFTIFVFFIIARFRTFEDPKYSEVKVLKAIRGFWENIDIRNVFLSHFLLQVFFTWMVIYAPLYLATEIGFTWDVIGSILAVGLFAYVIFEYPIGIIADRWIGEKEMMALGFLILAVSTSWISFMAGATVIGWMVLLFITRLGAALIETTTESYFFKHTDGSDSNVISFFRITRPLAMVFGALLGSVTLLYLPFNLIFVVLGLMMIPGIFFALSLKDTK